MIIFFLLFWDLRNILFAAFNAELTFVEPEEIFVCFI